MFYVLGIEYSLMGRQRMKAKPNNKVSWVLITYLENYSESILPKRKFKKFPIVDNTCLLTYRVHLAIKNGHNAEFRTAE